MARWDTRGRQANGGEGDEAAGEHVNRSSLILDGLHGTETRFVDSDSRGMYRLQKAARQMRWLYFHGIQMTLMNIFVWQFGRCKRACGEGNTL